MSKYEAQYEAQHATLDSAFAPTPLFTASTQPPLEIWAGVECTVNRVKDYYHDQLELSGHAARLPDLEAFAALGVKTVRYPVLWERSVERADDKTCRPDAVRWTNERLARLRELDINPIGGLVHHGSGARGTNLMDERFPELLAAYARRVAERYPWVSAYTPINEPLTTARFSGLYGLWYPHKHNARSFVRALLVQCRATVLAMREIRQVNSAAQLIQTEDLSKTWSTPPLRYQAEFENERRWLTFDLLCGRVTRAHPLWKFLRDVGGATEAELWWFAENPCPPDVFGFNYYLGSERFLDHQSGRYPAHARGGNGRHVYADTAATRVRAEGFAGVGGLLSEAWQRYERPLALTEVHNGCTREEQLRWFVETHGEVQKLRRAQVDVRAITAWSWLGSFNWNVLLTHQTDHYEPGVFDVRASCPRPTIVARAVEHLAHGRAFNHPVLDVKGWWHRPLRFKYNFAVSDTGKRIEAPANADWRTTTETWKSARPLLITGASGTLGRAFAKLCQQRGLAYRLVSRREMDIADPHSVERMITETKPWAIINTAGFVRVDDAEFESDACFRENTDGAATLAAMCRAHNTRLVTFSSDLVFDGEQTAPYIESDTPRPLNVYGESKLLAERRVLEILPSALVIRTSAFFGLWDEHNFLIHALRHVAKGQTFAAPDDVRITPTFVPDLVHATLDLLIDGERGIWHLTNSDGDMTWAEFARRAVEAANMDAALIEPRPVATFDFAARRPVNTALASERGFNLLPKLDASIARFLNECEIQWQPASATEPVIALPRALAAANAST
ncbi:MAG: sugar nucleotide-binding protein [Pyrinomonadaceae bacterium MAG19_C2-C3]|nr:sugar nucleotide-binding protein [Pyrinomonadaceae bacterium MAG19_C2-C3]